VTYPLLDFFAAGLAFLSSLPFAEAFRLSPPSSSSLSLPLPLSLSDSSSADSA
jgi:hypothetical protein